MRQVLKRLQVPLPYRSEEFFKICRDYEVPNDPINYQDEKFYWTYQQGVKWPDDYIGPDSMTRWIIEKSQDPTDVGLHRISESVRTYAYLLLSSQASTRSGIVGNTVSALTTQKAFLNNFENVINRRVPGGYFQIRRSGGLDLTSSLEAKFGARSGQVHQIRRKFGNFCHHKTQKLGKSPNFGVISEI